MPKVLVVDDEPGYRDELLLALSQAGHEVSVAATAHEAIDAGISCRPDVLVADWMLKNDIHGLRLAEVLRVVRPDLRTILITGFGSPDLRAEAERVRVSGFIEKPFHVDEIQEAVRDALSVPVAPPGRPLAAVLNVDAAGIFAYVNARARELFVETRAGANASRLGDLFAPDELRLLEDAVRRWVDVSPDAVGPVSWHVRAKPCPETATRLLVVLPAEERERKHHPVIRMLLGAVEPALARWPSDGHVLIMDRSAVVRRVLIAELEQTGCICHAAADVEVGSRLLRSDRDIQVVIIDADQPAQGIGRVIERLRGIRADAKIVGTGPETCRTDFDRVGADLFLPKPFVIDDLINLLTGRIGNCVDCGLPIPLRRLRPDDVGGSWECGGCGARYFAVLDESCPAETHGNVRRADRTGPSPPPAA